MNFKEFLKESEYTPSKFTPKQVEEFATGIINGERFEWAILYRGFDGGLADGTGDFMGCVKVIEREIKKYKVDCIGIVGLEGESIYDSVVMMYDPKTKKWSLA